MTFSFSAIWTHLQRSTFARQAATLMMGTGLAQALPIVVSPILTRLYGPADYGAFSLFVALTGILSIVATGRYELAILLPESDEDAANLTVLVVATGLVLSLVFQVVFWIAGPAIARKLGNPGITPWLVLLPATVFAMSCYQALNFWFNRKQNYRLIALNRVVRAAITVTLMVAFGLSDILPGGMVIATAVGQLLATVWFVAQAIRDSRPELARVTRSGMRAVARRYRDFPRFSVPADSINATSAQLPLLLLGTFFGPVIAGLYGLTQRVLGGPLGIVSTAFADVFKQRASRDYNALGNCRALWWTTFKYLTILSILPSLVILFAAPPLFAWVFGAEWRPAGEFARLLTPYFFLAFTVSPLSRTLLVAERQRANLVWQVALLAITGTALYVGGMLHRPLLAVGLYSGAYSLMYLVYLWMSHHYAGGSSRPRGGSMSLGLETLSTGTAR